MAPPWDELLQTAGHFKLSGPQLSAPQHVCGSAALQGLKRLHVKLHFWPVLGT